jgi:predicted amidohydrolase
MDTVRIAAAQTPQFWQDTDAALDYAAQAAARAEAEGAALLCFPEGYLQGYLVEEAAARRHALDLASPPFEAVLRRLAGLAPTLVLGLIEADGPDLFNTAVVIASGRLMGRYRKAHLLPGEAAFRPGTEWPIFEAGGLRFGVNICYDTNFPQAARKVAEGGASLLVCPANNMMRRPAAEAWRDRHNPVRAERCRETGLWLLSADVTGARGERVAWGPTAVIDPQGAVVAQAPLDAPALLVFDMPRPAPAA